MSRTRGGRGPMGEGFYVDVRNHVLNHHAGQRGTTGARPPAKQYRGRP